MTSVVVTAQLRTRRSFNGEVAFGWARGALAIGERSLPVQADKFSRKDYMLAQLLALLVLRKFFCTDYRGVVAIVRAWTELQETLGVAKVPDHSPLWHVE
jgi:hypothetical protein